MIKEIMVKISRLSSARHYHSLKCPLAQSEDYEILPISKVAKIKPNSLLKHYIPCSCMKKIE